MAEKEKKKKSPDKKQICIGCGISAGLFIVVIIIIAAIFGSGDPRFDKVKSPTNQSSVTLSANNAYKNAKIEFYQEGTKTQDLKSDGNGKFSVKVDLKEGDNKFKATATSEKGKTKTGKEINVFYDKTPPILVLAQTKIETDSDKAEISGETEKNSTLTLWVNDKEIGKTTAKGGKFKFDVKDLKNGENKFIIKVTDEAGNVGEQKEVVIIYTPKPAPIVNTNTPTSTPTPTPTPTSTPTPTPTSTQPKVQSYQQIFAFSGNGSKKSEPFTITGDRFKIKYDCKITSEYGGICQAFVGRVDNEWDMETIMNQANQSITDETIIYGSGTWYIDSNSSGSYTMIVEDYKY